MSPPETRERCVEQLPPSLRNAVEPVFAEPWQAQVFALAVNLIESGRVSWSEWSATLGDEIAHARESGIAEDGSGYYALWLRTLERVVIQRGMSTEPELEDLKSAWHDAFRDTPHGQPVSISGKQGTDPIYE